MTRLALSLIRFYQKYLSFLNGPSVCRYSPTCSEYSYQVISQYGILKGALLGTRRVLSCHPWSKHNYG